MWVTVRLCPKTTPRVTSEWVGRVNKQGKNQHLEELAYIREGALVAITVCWGCGYRVVTAAVVISYGQWL